MIRCHIEPLGIFVEIEEGETLHAGLEKSGIHIETPCGGNGTCGACRVWVSPPEKISSTPHENILPEDDVKGLRLACRTFPMEDISIRLGDNFIHDKADRSQGKILLHATLSGTIAFNPAATVTKDGDSFKLWYDRVSEPILLEDARPSFTPVGLAVDIGTTTVVVCLVSLVTGEILGTASSLNPQVIHGHDVLTRILYSKTREGLEEMASLIRNKLNSLTRELCLSLNTRQEEIVDGVIGANTTMLQLAAQMESASIGRSPFTFDIRGGTLYPAGFFGLNGNKAAKIYLPPILHAYVGTDISAGLLVCPDFFDNDKTILFIDMGTNGEICLNVKGRHYTTSTAAGPAFEGMGVSSGMRATDGAVEKVEIRDAFFQFHTINNGPIKGICGSGMVDLIAALLTSGYLDVSGRLLKKDDPFIVQFNDHLAFQYGDGIYLTQKDIRQIQLAKGAVRTGMDLIMEAGGIGCEDLDKIYVAGGFGNYLQPVHMERIGLIPKNTASKIMFCGNTSVAGSIALLVNKDRRAFLESALKKMTYLQLAESKAFMGCFLKNLDFSPEF
ncbi:MAG: hypothetical protein A2277_14230 [Desulfobacterales bacterium RIFOXYA12_FULL_46_15]|nr:MAG: hypothetical protein A2277_14230 [Desulfobacterales bacterium RIFOXYA12_FULL_46_15]